MKDQNIVLVSGYVSTQHAHNKPHVAKASYFLVLMLIIFWWKIDVFEDISKDIKQGKVDGQEESEVIAQQ